MTGPSQATGPGSARTAGRAGHCRVTAPRYRPVTSGRAGREPSSATAGRTPTPPACMCVGTGREPLRAPARPGALQVAACRQSPTATSSPCGPTCPRPHGPPAPPLAFGAANGAAAVRLGPPAAGRGRVVGWGGVRGVE